MTSINPRDFLPTSWITSIFSCKFCVVVGSKYIDTIAFLLSSGTFDLYGGRYILSVSNFKSSFLSNLSWILVPNIPSFKNWIVSIFLVPTGTKPKLIKGSNCIKGCGKYAFKGKINLKSFSLVMTISSNWSSVIFCSVSNITINSRWSPGGICVLLFFLSVSTLKRPFGCFIFTLFVFLEILQIFTGISYILFFSTSINDNSYIFYW